MNVLAFGETLWDVYPNARYLGGATLNFAAHLAKCGAEAWINTSVGNDSMGADAISAIKNWNIHTDYVSVLGKETGKCLVTLDSNQIPSYDLLDDVAYDYIEAPKLTDPFDLLYFGTLALRNAHNRKAIREILDKNEFGDVFVDVNIRPPFYSDEVVQFAMKHATIVKISDEELSKVMQAIGEDCASLSECAKLLHEKFDNLKLIIITRGGSGSSIYECALDAWYERNAEKVEVVSTVGAGDSFSAAFVAKYYQTKDINASLSFATKISGYVVSCMDAVPEYDAKDFE